MHDNCSFHFASRLILFLTCIPFLCCCNWLRDISATFPPLLLQRFTGICCLCYSSDAASSLFEKHYFRANQRIHFHFLIHQNIYLLGRISLIALSVESFFTHAFELEAILKKVSVGCVV